MSPISLALTMLLLAAGSAATPPEVTPDHAARMLQSRKLFEQHVRAILADREIRQRGRRLRKVRAAQFRNDPSLRTAWAFLRNG